MNYLLINPLYLLYSASWHLKAATCFVCSDHRIQRKCSILNLQYKSPRVKARSQRVLLPENSRLFAFLLNFILFETGSGGNYFLSHFYVSFPSIRFLQRIRGNDAREDERLPLVPRFRGRLDENVDAEKVLLNLSFI